MATICDMAIEWHSKVAKAFTLQDAVNLTGTRLTGLLGWQELPGKVEARQATPARYRGEEQSDPIPPSLLNKRIDPYPAEPPPPEQSHTVVAEAIFEIPDWQASAIVTVDDFPPFSEDPETGRFAWVLAARSPESKVMAIAATLALAECGGGPITDCGDLSDFDTDSPTRIFERLRVRTPPHSLDAAVDAVLARTTGLTGRHRHTA